MVALPAKVNKLTLFMRRRGQCQRELPVIVDLTCFKPGIDSCCEARHRINAYAGGGLRCGARWLGNRVADSKDRPSQMRLRRYGNFRPRRRVLDGVEASLPGDGYDRVKNRGGKLGAKIFSAYLNDWRAVEL